VVVGRDFARIGVYKVGQGGHGAKEDVGVRGVLLVLQ